MITRTFRQRSLPAHSLTVDELGEICRTLLARFPEGEGTEIMITFLTKGNNPKGHIFLSIEDLIKNGKNIKLPIGAYTLDIERNDDKDGLLKVEVSPPFAQHFFQTQAIIIARSRSEGWCADVIETASIKYHEYKIRGGWIYNSNVAWAIAMISAFIAGIVFSRIRTDGIETLDPLAGGLFALLCTIAFFVWWFMIGGPLRSRTAQIQDRKTVNWPPIALVGIGVLQLAATIVAVVLNLT